jgi:hypothetical protein
MTYIIFRLLYNLFDLCQVSLSKTAKHWDSFFTHYTVLIKAMQRAGVRSSCHVSIEEQLSIFLYTAVTGMTCTHVLRVTSGQSRIVRSYSQ